MECLLKVGDKVYIRATVTALKPDGTAKTVQIDKTPEGAVYLYTVEADQSTTEVLD